MLPLVALTSFKALTWFGGAPWTQPSTKVVLILGGSGGTGSAGIQLAKQEYQAGRVITTCGGENADYVKGLGADQVIDYHTSNW